MANGSPAPCCAFESMQHSNYKFLWPGNAISNHFFSHHTYQRWGDSKQGFKSAAICHLNVVLIPHNERQYCYNLTKDLIKLAQFFPFVVPSQFASPKMQRDTSHFHLHLKFSLPLCYFVMYFNLLSPLSPHSGGRVFGALLKLLQLNRPHTTPR